MKKLIVGMFISIFTITPVYGYADTLVEQYGITSIQYAVIKDNEIVNSAVSGVYSINNDTQLTTEHMYPIASISKMYTTAAVMMLVEQGIVALDEPIVTYLPSFTLADERYVDITLRMLLNHSSGLLGSSISNILLYDDTDQTEYDTILERLSQERLKADPGEYSVYCNDGFTLAQLIVETVSGMTFTQFIHTYITTPLQLENTKTPQDEFDTEQVVKTYSQTYQGNMDGIDYPIEMYNYIGTGGLYSTAEDLCKFATIFLNDGIISETSIEQTMEAEYLTGIWHEGIASNITFGLGWDSVEINPFNAADIQVVAKSGDTLQSHATLMVVPEVEMAVAVLMSGGNGLFSQMLASQLLMDELLNDGYISQIPSVNESITFEEPIAVPDGYTQYSGLYANTYSDYTVTVYEDGILTVTANQSPWYYTQTLYHIGDGVFVDYSGNTQITFVTETNGITYLHTQCYLDIELVPITLSQYELQKLEPIQIDEQYTAAWASRSNKEYVIVSEKYSSQLLSLYSHISIPIISYEGYVGHYQIVDEFNLQNTIQIPQSYGRDITDITIYTSEGIEYLIYDNSVFMEKDKVSPLFINEKTTYTIDNQGFARWFSIEPNIYGNTIKVDINGNGMFSIYNYYGECIYNSYLEGNKTISLQPSTYIMLAGDIGTTFTIEQY